MALFKNDDTQSQDPPQEDSRLARSAMAGVRALVDVGIDGGGPMKSAEEVAAEEMAANPDPEAAIKAIAKDHVKAAAGAGFVTGVGGLLTMPVALPANVAGFYVLAGRMVGAIAHLRGYDVQSPQTRTALVLTLLGADGDDILRKAGVASGGRMAHIAMDRVPRAVAMMINKGVGFRVATQLGAQAAGRLGRAVPIAGGVLGAVLDGYLMRKLAARAKEEFPPRDSLEAGDPGS